MLQNRLYRGQIVHKDKSYPGEHEAIVDEALWDKVQAILSANRIGRTGGNTSTEPSLLKGILFDAQGGRMTPTHANKKGTRYRYYISRSLLGGSTTVKTAGQRIPAVALESLVFQRIRAWLADPAAVLQVIQDAAPDAAAQKPLIERAKDIAGGESSGIHTFMRCAVVRIQVHADRIDIGLDPDRAGHCLQQSAEKFESTDEPQSETDRQQVTLSIPARLKRTGKEMRIVVADGSSPANADSSLVRLLVRASAIREKLFSDRSLTFEDVAKSEGVVPSYATRLFRLTVLAPDIVSAILNGRHPPDLTARLDDTRLPLDWSEHRRHLGFLSS